jgi:hypothetical protein
MPKIDDLLAAFHGDIAQLAEQKTRYQELMLKLHQLNPCFEPISAIDHFGALPEAIVAELDEEQKERLLVLVNIYTAIYVPLIHAFSYFVLTNIQAGKLPNNLLIPPRDPIPIYFAMHAQAGTLGMVLNTITPAMNRKIAGIANNQSDYSPQVDPLFHDYVKQELAALGSPDEIVEIEPGVYSTTSLRIAQYMNDNGHKIAYIPVKIYGRGPNISFIHWLLTDEQTAIAELAEANPVVMELADKCMVILDTLEEFGAQNAYHSPASLEGTKPDIKPVTVANDPFAQALASLTNASIIHSADSYLAIADAPDGLFSLAKNLLLAVDDLMAMAADGFPVVFTEPIPPMDDREPHYQNLRAAQESGIINYKKLEKHES